MPKLASTVPPIPMDRLINLLLQMDYFMDHVKENAYHTERYRMSQSVWQRTHFKTFSLESEF